MFLLQKKKKERHKLSKGGVRTRNPEPFDFGLTINPLTSGQGFLIYDFKFCTLNMNRSRACGGAHERSE